MIKKILRFKRIWRFVKKLINWSWFTKPSLIEILVFCQNCKLPSSRFYNDSGSSRLQLLVRCHEPLDKLMYKSDEAEIHWDLEVGKLKVVAYVQLDAHQSMLTRCKNICREILFHLPYRTRHSFHSVWHVTTVLYSTDLRWLVIHFLCVSIFDFINCEYLCTWVITCLNGPRCHVESVLGWA